MKRETKRIRPHKKGRFFISSILFFSFFVSQTAFIPVSFSFPACSAASSAVAAQSDPASEFQFDTVRNEFTFIDYRTNSFAVFSDEDSLEVPVRMGRVEWADGALRLIPTREIESAGDLYIFRDPQNQDHLEVSERLAEGGFGRLLRYRGLTGEGKGVDLEFVYDDPARQLTILDRGKGRFFRSTFVQDRPDPLSLFPHPEEKGPDEELIATEAPSVKFLTPEETRIGPFAPQFEPLFYQTPLVSEQQIWLNRLVRGPPAGEAAL